MADRFEELNTFVTVVQEQSFSAAADRLRVVKSAVSRRIRDLEDRLGTRLIDRTSRKIHLTDTGDAFYERSLRLLADLEEAQNLASAGSRAVTGRLRIAAPVSLTTHCLAPVLCDFMALHPNLFIDVDTNDRKVELVGDGFDLAIRVSRLKDSALIARKITTVRHVCCASPRYLDQYGRPERPSDLRRHAGIVYSNVDLRDYWMFEGDESVEALSRLTISNGDAVREAAIAGAGIALLPTFIAHEAIVRGDLEMILKPYIRPPIGMYVVHPSNRNVPAKVRHFIDFLLTKFGDIPSWDRDIFTPVELANLYATGAPTA